MARVWTAALEGEESNRQKLMIQELYPYQSTLPCRVPDLEYPYTRAGFFIQILSGLPEDCFSQLLSSLRMFLSATSEQIAAVGGEVIGELS